MPEIQVQQPHPQDDEISLKELILKIKEWVIYLKTKWLIILSFGIIGAGIGYVYAYFQKPIYTATLTFALEDEKGGGGSGIGGALGFASSLGFDLGTSAGGAFSGTNLIELMKSRKIVELALLKPVKLGGKATTLAEFYLQFKNERKKWQASNLQLNDKVLFQPNSDRSRFSLQQDSVLGFMHSALIKENLFVNQKDKKVSILSVDVKTENEIFSKLFAEAVVDEVSDFYIDTKSKKARLNVEILEKQSDSIRAELNAAIQGVAKATDDIYNLNSALNIKRAPATKRQIDVQANTAILTQLVSNLELARVTLRKETPLIQVVDKPILPLSKEKVGKLKSLIIGGMLAGLLIIVFLIIRKIFKNVFAK